MLFVAAPNAHTYRLLIFKDLVLHCEAFCSQQRDEIMKCFVHLVNPLVFLNIYMSRIARDRIITRDAWFDKG